MQGVPEEDATATATSQAHQMSEGRLTSTARMISMQGLVQQTVRCVKNFQQFLEESIVVRIRGDDAEYRPQFKDKKAITLNRDQIQMEFDVVPHDGTMPGTDAKAVAAGTRLLEASQAFPEIFNDTQAGNLDLKDMVYWIAKKSGFPVDNFVITEEQALQNAVKKGLIPPPQDPGAAAMGAPLIPPPPATPAGAVNLPGEQVPVGGGLTLPDAGPSSIPSASPPQVRPQNV